MNSPAKDYNKLYKLQDSFLSWWSKLNFPFYLTGGTALGRFYFQHRFSEDLDFFVNAHPDFLKYLEKIRRPLTEKFKVNMADALVTEDFARFFISDGNQRLKIDFVNDVAYYAGKVISYPYGFIVNPLNIITNKLSAIAGGDEPKDFYDILQLSLNYSFNWTAVFLLAKEKAMLNELVIAERLSNFQVNSFTYVDWLIESIEIDKLSLQMEILSNDFLLGRDNSLGSGKPAIDEVFKIS